jgi:stage V sporulation protein B
MPPSDKAVGAGRGVLYIAIAKLYFIVAGFLIEVRLPIYLGNALYGAYALVAQWVSNINNVIVTGTIQAVSRYTTADLDRADDVKAAGLRMQLYITVPLAAAYAALAPLWAWLEHDPGKTGLLALSGGIVALYALYTVFVGSANGTRQFHKQAGLDMTFATLRVTGVLGAAFLGFGVFGAIGAWVAAAGVILIVAASVIGVPRDLRAGNVAPLVTFLGGVALYLLIMSFITSADLLLLKRLIAEWYLRHGEVGDVASLADGQVGYYRVVQNLARLPYQLMIAVTFVVFPLVSRSVFEKDAEKTRAYVRTTMRYSLVFAGLMGAVLAARSGGLMELLGYKSEYAVEGGLAASILALGHVAFALFTIAGTILNGAGRTADAVAVAATTLLLLVVLLFVGIPLGTPGREVLAICAAATSTAMLVGAGVSGWFLWRRFGSFLPALTVVRVVLAIAATLGVGRLVTAPGKLMTIVAAALSAAVYLGVILVTGELGRRDLAALRPRKG